MSSRKNIDNAEIMKEARSWLASFTNGELSKKIDVMEKKFISDLEGVKKSEWVRRKDESVKLNIKCPLITKRVDKKFDWSLSKTHFEIQIVHKVKDPLKDLKEAV